MTATAYSLKGATKSGEPVQPGVVAVDPKVIPLGSTVRLHDAGEYSGKYRAVDTGRHIRGNRIDIYMEKRREAKEFGRQQVEVEVLD